MIKRTALVILSGGQDSTTCLFWAKREYAGVRAVTFDYGQRHAREIEAACDIAKRAGVLSHDVISISRDCLRSSSPLTSDTPLEKYEGPEQMAGVIGDRIELTFVPMRNMMFLTVAMNLACYYGIVDLITGVCQEDNANYPDCTEHFIHSAEHAFRFGLSNDLIEIVTPLMRCSKADTVRLAMDLPGCMEALAFSHTSYDGRYPPTDMNHANVLRADGFAKAGVPDPLVVRAWSEGLMELPDTSNYNGVSEGKINPYK